MDSKACLAQLREHRDSQAYQLVLKLLEAQLREDQALFLRAQSTEELWRLQGKSNRSNDLIRLLTGNPYPSAPREG